MRYPWGGPGNDTITIVHIDGDRAEGEDGEPITGQVNVRLATAWAGEFRRVVLAAARSTPEREEGRAAP